MGRFLIENNKLIGYDNGGETIVDTVEVPEGVTHINYSVFSKVKEIKTLILPKSLKYMTLPSWYEIKIGQAIVKDPKGWVMVGYTDWAGQRMEDRINEREMADPKECLRYLYEKGCSCGSYGVIEKE